MTATPPHSISSRRMSDLTPRGKKSRETWVELAVPHPLEVPVVRVRVVWLGPDPFVPPREVLPELLTRLLLEEAEERDEAHDPRTGRALEPRQVPDDPRIAVPPLRADLGERRLSLRRIWCRGREEQLDIRMVRFAERCPGWPRHPGTAASRSTRPRAVLGARRYALRSGCLAGLGAARDACHGLLGDRVWWAMEGPYLASGSGRSWK